MNGAAQAWALYVRESEEAYERAAGRQDTIWIMEGKSSEGWLEAKATTELARSLCEARGVAYAAFLEWTESRPQGRGSSR